MKKISSHNIMTYYQHSHYPKYVYGEGDEFIYTWIDPRESDTDIVLEEMDDNIEALDETSFEIYRHKDINYALNRHTGIMLKLDSGGNVVKYTDDIVWFNPNDDSINTGKNDEVREVLMSSNLTSLKFTLPAVAAVAEVAAAVEVQKTEDTFDIEDLFGTEIDQSEFQEVIVVNRSIAEKGVEREEISYAENLRSLIENDRINSEQINRNLEIYESLISNAAKRQIDVKRKESQTPSWLIPIVSDEANSKYIGDEALGLALARTYDESDKRHRIGTSSYNQFISGITSGRLPKASDQKNIETVMEQPLNHLKLLINPTQNHCDSSYTGAVISQELLLTDNKKYSSIYNVPGPEYSHELILDDLEVAKIAKSRKPGLFVVIAQRGTGITGLKCSRAQDLDRRLFITGYVKLPMRNLSALKRLETISNLRSKPMVTLTKSHVIDKEYMDRGEIFNFAEDTIKPLELLMPSMAKVAELYNTRIFRNFQEIADLYSLYGYDPKDITLEILKKFKFNENPVLYNRNKLYDQFRLIDDTKLRDDEWIFANQSRLKDLYPPVQARSTPYELWKSLSSDQKQQVRVLRADVRNVIDPDEFNDNITEYEMTSPYPYGYSVFDNDETRVGWLSRRPDFGELYFLKLQLQDSDSNHAAIFREQSITPLIPPTGLPDSAAYFAATRKLFRINEDKLYIWSGEQYFSREDYLKMLTNGRIETFLKNREEYISTQNNIDVLNEHGILILRGNIINSVVPRKLETVVPIINSRTGTKLFRYVNSLNRDIIEQRNVFLRFLKTPHVTLNHNNQYILIESQEIICCIHEKEMYDLNEYQLTERYGDTTLDGSQICKYCKSVLEEFRDEHQGFANNAPIRAHDVIEQDKSEETIYDSSSELQTMIYRITEYFSKQIKQVILKSESHRSLIEDISSELEDDLEDDKNVDKWMGLPSLKNPNIGDLISRKKVGMIMKVLSGDQNKNKEFIHGCLIITNLVYRLPTILSKLLVEFEINHGKYVSNGVLQIVNETTDHMQQLFVLSGGIRYDYNILSRGLQISEITDLQKYLFDHTFHKYQALRNDKYFDKYDELDKELSVDLNALDYSDLTKIGPGTFGFVTEVTGLTGKSAHLRNLARASARVNELYKVSEDLREWISTTPVVTGTLKDISFAEYDAYSRTYVDDDMLEAGYVPPSMCMAGQMLTGQSSVVMNADLTLGNGTMPQGMGPFSQNLEQLDTLVKDFNAKLKFGLEQEQFTSQRTTSDILNSSNRLYRIQDTQYLPPSLKSTDIEILKLQYSGQTNTQISERTKRVAQYLLSEGLEKRFKSKLGLFIVKTGSGSGSEDLSRILGTFGIPFPRALELSQYFKDDLTTMKNVTSNLYDDVLSPMDADHVNQIFSIVGISPIANTTSPAKDENNVFLTKNCRHADAPRKLKNLYNLIGAAINKCSDLGSNADATSTISKLVSDKKPTLTDRDKEIFGSYKQYCSDIFDLSVEHILQIVKVQSADAVYDHLKKLYINALLLELTIHLYRLNANETSRYMPDFTIDTISTVGGAGAAGGTGAVVKSIDSILDSVIPANPSAASFAEFVNKIITYALETHKITDPLNSATYKIPLAKHEYDIMKKMIMEPKRNWDLHNAGLSLADLEEKLAGLTYQEDKPEPSDPNEDEDEADEEEDAQDGNVENY